jgi:hypothetical protein
MLPAGISSAFSCSNKPGSEIIKLTFSSGTTGNDKINTCTLSRCQSTKADWSRISWKSFEEHWQQQQQQQEE